MSTIRDIVDYISDVEYYSQFFVPVEHFEKESSGAVVSSIVLMNFLKFHNDFGIEHCIAFINERRTIQVDDFVQRTLKQQGRKFSQQDRERFRINTLNAMAGQDLKSVAYGYHIVVKFFKGNPSYAPVMTLSTTIYADDWFFGNGDVKERVLKKYLLEEQ